MLSSFPKILKDNLIKQEKLINLFKLREKKDKAFNDYLCKKVSKKTEETLISKSNHFRVKSQINNLLSLKEPLDRKFGPNTW